MENVYEVKLEKLIEKMELVGSEGVAGFLKKFLTKK